MAGSGAAMPEVPTIEPGAPVVCVGEDDLAAVVSPVPLDLFDPEVLEARLTDLTWLAPRARAHQAVLAGIDAPIAPLRFGTIFRDEGGVRAMLRTNGPLFRAALDRLAGRREWGVKIYADPKRVSDHVLISSTRVRDLIAQRNRMSSGAAYMLQKKLDILILEESRRLADLCICESQARLSARAAATAGGPTSQRSEDGPELIFSGAYLVDETRFSDFAGEIRTLVNQYDCFGFDLTGPWPAYSFASAPEQELDDA